MDTQENVVLVGSAEPADGGRIHVRVERALSDWSITGSRLRRDGLGFLPTGGPCAPGSRPKPPAAASPRHACA